MPADRRPDPVLEVLARGGFVHTAAVDDQAGALGSEPPRYNGLLDPAGAEDLGARLATALEPYAPGLVLIWQNPDDIVLAHVVARELEVSAVRSFDREGLVAHDGSLDEHGEVAIVSDVFHEAESIKAMSLLVEQRGARVVAAACLAAVDGPGVRELEARGVPLVALVDLRARRPEGAVNG